MEAKTVGHQAEANHQQEAQAEDHNGRVTGHHHRKVVHHPDGGDHRVQGENRIQHHDLRDHRPEFCSAALGRVLAVFAFQPLVELHGSFEQQE